MLAAHAFFDTTDVAVPAWDDITAVDVRSFADLTGEIDARELAVGDKTSIDIRAFGFGDEPTAVDIEIDLDAFAFEPTVLAAVVDEVT